MAEFDKAFEGKNSQSSIFQQQLQTEQAANAFQQPPEPSTAEKLAGALPGLISAGVQLGGAMAQKKKESALAEQDQKIAKHYLAPQTLLQQKGPSGKNEATNIAGHIKTQLLKEAYASGDLDYVKKVMTAHENFLAGNKDLLAPTKDEVLAQAQFEGQVAATKKLSELSATTGISMKNLQAMENRTKRLEDKKNEMALLDLTNKEEVLAASNDIADLADQSMNQHVDAAQITLSQLAQSDPAMLTQEFPRIKDDMVRGIEREAADLSAQIRANVRDPQTRDNTLAMIEERKKASLEQLPALDKILKTNVDMAKNANVMVANRLTPTLAMVSDAYGQMAPDVFRVMTNPGTREIAFSALPGLREAMAAGSNDVVGPALVARALGFNTMDKRLNGYDQNAVDAGIAATANAIKADPQASLEMKQVVQSTMLDKVKGENADKVSKIMAGNMTKNTKHIIYSNPELQKKMSNSMSNWRTQLATENRNKMEGFGQIKTPMRIKLTDQNGKFGHEISNLQDLRNATVDTEWHQQTRQHLPFEAIAKYASQGKQYEDLAVDTGDGSIEDQIKRIFGVDIIIER